MVGKDEQRREYLLGRWVSFASNGAECVLRVYDVPGPWDIPMELLAVARKIADARREELIVLALKELEGANGN
jgi:hypothetical protein